MSWSRKNSTVAREQRADLGDESGVARGDPRFTLESSAPIVHVSGSTLIEPRVAICAGAFASVVVSVIAFS
jgi:hypothetical protein